MGVVNQAVQVGIGVSRITDQFMPSGYRELAGDEGRAAAISVLEDFQQVVPGVAIEGFKAPVIENEQVDPSKTLHTRGDPAVTLGKGQFVDWPW